VKKVLFLCTGNSCRSQIAEGFLRESGEGKFEAFSAGTFPKEEIHPLAIQVMQELGIDISSQKPKEIEFLLQEKIDLVITVCDNAKEACPNFPAKVETLHWSFEDPAEALGSEEEKLTFFRRVREQIKEKINNQLVHPQNIKS